MYYLLDYPGGVQILGQLEKCLSKRQREAFRGSRGKALIGQRPLKLNSRMTVPRLRRSAR